MGSSVPIWIWPFAAALLGGYVYVCVADLRSPLDRIARQELRDLKRQGVAIDRVQLVHFLFQAPTPESAYQLRGRPQALSLDARLTTPARSRPRGSGGGAHRDGPRRRVCQRHVARSGGPSQLHSDARGASSLPAAIPSARAGSRGRVHWLVHCLNRWGLRPDHGMQPTGPREPSAP